MLKSKVTQKFEGWPEQKLERTEETNNFKNKVMVQESQYTSDGYLRGL